MARIEKHDNFAEFRNSIRELAERIGEYAGVPMPLDKHSLVIEPRYARANKLMEALDMRIDKDDSIEDGVTLRNAFWSHRLQSDVLIWSEANGKIKWGAIPYNSRLTMLLNTLDCNPVWGIDQESNAIQLLTTLLSHHQFKLYMLTGMFAERSKRSGLTYIFRRLRPTLVIDARENDKEPNARCVAALCMHPIAYYSGTWAGAMCPTDDVIAHLMMMRGDEVQYWRRSSQHHPRSPQAGI